MGVKPSTTTIMKEKNKQQITLKEGDISINEVSIHKGFLTTHRSTSWYCVFLGNNFLFGSSKRHVTFSRSSAEAEYHGVINIYFVTDLVAAGHMRILHVPFRYQLANIFTKSIPPALFAEFCDNLSVRSTPAPTEGVVDLFVLV
nr:hypothetical protein [Tanacetum cinerariifolium]